MSGRANAPIVIKRRRAIPDSVPHGGTWKIAYADFVTAMMAFFLLMWLVNATTETERRGLANYFSPSIPVTRISGGGDGALGGDSVFTQDSLARSGVGATSPLDHEQNAADIRARQDASFEAFQERLLGRGAEALLTENEMRHIVTRVTEAGLVVELFSLPGAPLFDPVTDGRTPLLDSLLHAVGTLFAMTANRVAIDGHSRAQPVVLRDNPVWERSVARAQLAQGILVGYFDEARLHRVSGFADRRQAAAQPMSPRNDRLELTLLRRDFP